MKSMKSHKILLVIYKKEIKLWTFYGCKTLKFQNKNIKLLFSEKINVFFKYGPRSGRLGAEIWFGSKDVFNLVYPNPVSYIGKNSLFLFKVRTYEYAGFTYILLYWSKTL